MTSAVISSSLPSPVAPLLETPSHFATIAPHIYRSRVFTQTAHPFLRTLQLRTILSLTPELPSRSLASFCSAQGIKFIHFGLDSWRCINDALSYGGGQAGARGPAGAVLGNWNPTNMSEELVKNGLEILLDRRSHPVLVMDTSGIHETGVLFGCLRKLQRWNFASILVEYRSFAGSRARAANERFIEMFDTDLITLPAREHLPTWFARQLDLDAAELEEEERALEEAEENMLAQVHGELQAEEAERGRTVQRV